MNAKNIFGIILLMAISFLNTISGQTYNLVWEDNFNGNSLDSSIWNVEERVGIWNTAQNGELQFYKTDNVSVGDDGYGNNCLILSALKETYKGYSFTSGRVNTNTKFSFKYGKLEARIKIPDLKNGLWPAFWTEGFTSLGWPDMGEIDILEMGHSEGIALDSVNSFVASATHWEYNGTRADYSQSILAPVDLSDDYHLITMIWTSTGITTSLDGTIFFTFATTGSDLEEYKTFFNFILINLAVGGILPGISTPANVTAPFPAKMYIDYIKLYQIAGQENFTVGPHVIVGDFGVYSENNLTASMNTKFDALIVKEGLDSTFTSPYEGFQTLSFATKASEKFKLAVNSYTDRNMSGYTNGSINFMIKTSFAQSFVLSFIDKNGDSASVTIDQTKFFNPDRNNSWALVSVPISDFTGAVDFTNLISLFSLSGTGSATSSSIAVDNIIWKETSAGGPISDQYYGVFAEHPSITNRLDFGAGGHLYVWNGFAAGTVPAFYGKSVISFYPNTGTWNGFGIQSENPINLFNFSTGYLNFLIKTSSTAEFSFGFKNLSDQAWEIKYTAGSSTSAFKRDGKWHLLSIPLSSFIPVAPTPALSPKLIDDITIPFYLVGTINFAIDEVFFSKDKTRPNYGINITDVYNESVDNILVYPVPARDFISIKGITGETAIEVFNIDGRLIQSLKPDSDIDLDISNYSSGLYLINIVSQKGTLKKKFIVE
jgi:beta-glucanase (GH16 family)